MSPASRTEHHLSGYGGQAAIPPVRSGSVEDQPQPPPLFWYRSSAVLASNFMTTAETAAGTLLSRSLGEIGFLADDSAPIPSGQTP